ncbi:helix-turn-helix domain-containing protein [Paenibacillus sp. OAS669]|uniref:helix-turn-helix domain-containing protein n=1 Tax=Paenibacillus sp. OAS669 TaxID=2663821 RepID=UPI0019EB625E|nr:helix-turn-helix domain-containing protein [Paenibacillus sp. OAS669]MBE1445404.1 AraC-like DNA-binding protein [Paenibacillus sp. OAS669]
MYSNFSISVAKRAETYNFIKYHYHNFYEIYYLLAGERRYYIEDRTFLVKKGSLVFINKNQLHKTMEGSHPEHERVVLYFTDAFIKPFLQEQPDLLLPFQESCLLELNLQEQSRIEHILLELIREYGNTGLHGRELYFKTLVVQLLLFSIRKLSESSEVPHSRLHRTILAVLDYCGLHYHEPISLHSVAERFHVSDSYLSRLFKQHTGFHFSEYIHAFRIREAQRLIKETGLKMTDIAEQVGYINTTHFNRKFKQVARMSPSAYKKMIKSVNSGT